jgi:hypothetical protein
MRRDCKHNTGEVLYAFGVSGRGGLVAGFLHGRYSLVTAVATVVSCEWGIKGLAKQKGWAEWPHSSRPISART